MWLTEQAAASDGDLYEMMTYLLVVLVSGVVMTIWLKRKSRRKRRNDR